VKKLRAGGSGGRQSESARSEACRRLTEACVTAKQRPVCASDGLTYSSKCEIRRLRRCERRLVAVVSTGHCPIGKTHPSLSNSFAVADPEIVGGGCGRAERWWCVEGVSPPHGEGSQNFFPFCTSKWPVSVHSGCAGGVCIPIPPLDPPLCSIVERHRNAPNEVHVMLISRCVNAINSSWRIARRRVVTYGVQKTDSLFTCSLFTIYR